MSVIFPLSNYQVKQTYLPQVWVDSNGDIQGKKSLYTYLERTDGDDKLWTYHGQIQNGKANGVGRLFVYGVDNAHIHTYRGVFVNNQLYTEGLKVTFNNVREPEFDYECKCCN